MLACTDRAIGVTVGLLQMQLKHDIRQLMENEWPLLFLASMGADFYAEGSPCPAIPPDRQARHLGAPPRARVCSPKTAYCDAIRIHTLPYAVTVVNLTEYNLH